MGSFRRNHSLNSQANLNGSELKRRKDSSNKVAETNENESPFLHNRAPKKSQNLNGSELKRRKDSSNKVAETNENESPFLHNRAPKKSQDLRKEPKKKSNASSSFKKKILAEKKEDLLPDSSPSSHLESTPQSKYMPCAKPSEASIHNSPISLHSYDPIINYTSPRPKFLRYNPNQRRELLERIEGEKGSDEEVRSASSLSSPNFSSKSENDNEYEEEEELEEDKPLLHSCVVWSLLLMFGVLSFISYSMSFSSYENSAANIQKIQGKSPLRLVGGNFFPENLLGSLMRLSQMCPIVGESLCNFEENLVVSLEVDRTVGREHLGEGESSIERIRSKLSDKTEVLVAEVHELLLKNGGLVDDDSAAKEKMEHGDQNERDSGPLAEEGNANESISSVETLKEYNITSSTVESTLISLAQDVSDSSSTIRKDEYHNESLESIKFPSTCQSRVHESTSDGQSLASDTELKSDYSPNILSEGIILTFSIFLGSLTVIVGLSSLFHKYFRRPNLNSLHVNSSEFCLKTETGERIATNVPLKEENTDKTFDVSVESQSSRLNYVPSTSDHMNVELKEVSGVGPPRIEFLGEFSLVNGVTNNGFGSNLKKMEYPNSQFSYYQTGKAKKMLSPLPDKLYSSPEESTSSRFSSKVPADKGEISDTSATSSLRRSSRLRNRVIFP